MTTAASRVPTRRIRAVTASLITAALAIGGVGAASPAVADPTDHLHLRYAFDQAGGATAVDSSGHGRNGEIRGGATVSGGEGLVLDGTDDEVKLPDNVLSGLSSITISTEVLIRPTQPTPYMIWALGNTDSAGVGNGYLFATGDAYRAAIASGNWSTEQGISSGSALARGEWKTLAYTLDDATDTATLYLDGAEVKKATGVTLTPAQIGAGTTTANYIGRSVYTADRRLSGSIREFRIYDTALTPAEVAALTPADSTRVSRDAAALTLGDTSAVTTDVTLPARGVNGASISWSSSAPGVVSSTGKVTRPAAGEPDATVTLSASITRGSNSASREFTVTVTAQPGADVRAQADLDAVVIPNATDVRGNITLPEVGAVHGSTITWTASPDGVVSTSAQDGKAAGVVTRGSADTAVTLTASVAGTTATRSIPLTVRAAPEGLDTDYTAGYLWTHFATQGGYEKIYFGHSADGLQWSKLNDNGPILANLAGDLGVRDPHLVRSPEGDKYWIIGTDLHAEGGGAGGSGWDQLNASKNIVVWESTDLVTWSDQRIVFAGMDDAGCVWAPEAIYNEATGEYYVYWSARDRTDNGTDDWALRVYLTKTRDFATFTEPEIWLSLNDKGDGAGGPNIIDTTIAVEDGVYYRFSTSDWHTVIDTAPSLDGPWTRVVDRGEASSTGLRASMEGLTVYPLPDGRWSVMGDQSGYYAHTADTLESLTFRQLTAGTGADQYSFDAPFRHGSVLRLSAQEEARLLAAYGDQPIEPEEPEEPQEGPIAAYTFDDGTLKDTVGTNHLTASGTAAVATDGVAGAALRLDGSANGFASFPTGFFDGRDSMTVSMDVKSDLSSGNFFTFAFGRDTTDYYFLRTRGGDVRSAITSGSYQNESAVTGSVTAGAWHRYDVVFEGTRMRVYVDGVLLGENTALNTKVSELGSDLHGYLGKSFYGPDGYFRGWYDDVEVYNRALSSAEILGKSGATDQLVDVSVTDATALALAPIMNGSARTAVLPVTPGTDVTALAPTFATAAGVSVSPASGTTVDLSSPVTYTLTGPGGTTATWTISAQVVKSPVLPGLYADPNIAVFGDTYYIYATSDGVPGWGGNTFYVWKSTDLVTWTRSEQPFLTLDGANGNVPWATGNAWAPTIIERAGKYYFYFSGHNPTYNRKTIGVAVADSPEGPFTAQPSAMILNNEAVTSGQAIDPAAFHDPVTDTYYLAWGNGGPSTGPVIAELADDMVSIVPGTYRRISGLTDFREGLFLNYREGIYHLTYSIDDTGSENYRVGYATATSMNGPWTVRGTILQKDLSLGIKATGHSSIINVPGTDEWYIAYHRFALPSGDGTHRETTIDKLTIGPDGFFQPVTPTLTSVEPRPVPPSVSVSVTPSSRCIAGKALLVLSATNTSAIPANLEVATAYGTKRFTDVAPGKAVSATFSTRLGAMPAGTVTATAEGASAARTVETGYAARTCG